MKLFFKKVNKSNGFTLVETLIAISIFSLSIISLIAFLSQNISDMGYVKNKMKAAYLAQEGIEYARNMRDNYVLYTDITGSSWTDFVVWATPDIIYPSSEEAFQRVIQTNQISSDEIEISSTVSWTQKSGPFSITLTDVLFNWVE